MDQAICKGVAIHSPCWLCQRMSQVSIYVSERSANVWGTCWLHEAGSCQTISLVGAGIVHIVLHTGPWKKLAKYGPPSSFLLFQHPRVSSHLQRSTSATSYSPWGRAGRERPRAPIASDWDSRSGTERSPGSPSAGEQRESLKKGKTTGDKQVQERAPHWNVDFIQRMTQVKLLLASRESKANGWRLERRGVSISRTNSTRSLNQNTVIGSDIQKQKLFLNMSRNDSTYLKSGRHWAPGKQNSGRQSYLTPSSWCFWSFMADNSP